MHIIMNTYPAAFQCPGGGEIQLLKSKEFLENIGHSVTLFDQWNTDLSTADVVHYFSVQGGSSSFCNYVHENNIPLVISPILWPITEDMPKYPVEEINHLLSIADCVCPNSSLESEQLGELLELDLAKVVVTHNGIDKIFFNHVDGQIFRDNFSVDFDFVLCVGNIEPRKNQHRAMLAAKENNIKLILIGNIRDTSYFQQCGIEACDNTVYLGAIEHHSPLLRSAYMACRAFILPSLLETPGLAALEAAASGCKILITEVGATTEYFSNSAVYTNPFLQDDISRNLRSLLQTENSYDTNNAANKFSWERTAVQLENAYKHAIKQHRD
jgi:glycosyltransferase involved in cell wall biosynthesis